MIKEIVRLDAKQRYDLILEDAEGSKVATDLNATSSDAINTLWWIKARQGHSIKVRSLLPRSPINLSLPCNRQSNPSLGISLLMKIYPPESPFTVLPSKLGHLYVRISQHGDSSKTGQLNLIIHFIPGTQGLSKMGRNHIHLAQGVSQKRAMSGMSSLLFSVLQLKQFVLF